MRRALACISQLTQRPSSFQTAASAAADTSRFKSGKSHGHGHEHGHPEFPPAVASIALGGRPWSPIDGAAVDPVKHAYDLLNGVRRGIAVINFTHLGFPAALQSGAPKSIKDLSAELQTHPDYTLRFLRAIASVGLVKFEPHHTGHDALVRLTQLGAVFVPGHPAKAPEMVALAAGGPVLDNWVVRTGMDLHKIIKTGVFDGSSIGVTKATFWDKFFFSHPQGNERLAMAMGGMYAISNGAVDLIASHLKVAAGETVVDVAGGAHGLLVQAIVRKNPGAVGILHDLPPAVAMFKPAPDLASRVTSHGGSFFDQDGVPEGGSLYVLKHIIHDWDDEQSVKILKTVRGRVRPGGRVGIVEMVVPDDPSHVSPAALLDLDMMGLFDAKERTESEYKKLLNQAGFAPIGSHQVPGTPYTIVMGQA